MKKTTDDFKKDLKKKLTFDEVLSLIEMKDFKGEIVIPELGIKIIR